MKKNVGKVDQLIRYLLAAVLLVVGILLFNSLTWLAIVLFVLAAISAVTGAIGFCGLYTLLGINTCKVETKE
ncbi:MAG: DUF2892 domain-containing protein [Acholeplasmataceae bacterium]